MKKALLIDPFSGISGDMFLAALIDLGGDADGMMRAAKSIEALDVVDVGVEKVDRGAIRATKLNVECPEQHAHRGLTVIRNMIDASSLSDRVKKGAVQTFTVLAQAEAKVHGKAVEEIHFHEVGALDAIFDIVSAHVLLEQLGIDEVYVRPLRLGTGSTRSAHGEIPVPVPATLELLAGFPLEFGDRSQELVTPTGAAIVASVGKPLPADQRFTPTAVGYGAGQREGKDGLPNVLRVMTGEATPGYDYTCIVTTTIDDMNPEAYGFVMEGLLEAGAFDVYYTSVMMKKNRPGIEVTVISDEARLDRVIAFLMNQTTTLGLRVTREQRVELVRDRQTIETEFGAADVKIARRPDGRVTVSPEYDSCRAIAGRTGKPLLDVYEAVRTAWQKQNSES